MKDCMGREIEYVRISVTQNCNLNCIYCRPGNGNGNGYGYGNAASGYCDRLSAEEYGIIVRAMAGLGIKKVRITGGEPLTRKDICDIISHISAVQGIVDLSMTTNGLHLLDMADNLKAAGLGRLNISLDSLDAKKYEYITGGGNLANVLNGIYKALSAGLVPVKINAVLIKGVNDDEIESFMLLTRHLPVEVRFIELMPVGSYGENNRDKIVYNSEIIRSHPELKKSEEKESNQPAVYYYVEGYKGKIGFISALSHKFCNCCNRIRLTCDGKLKPCLGNNCEVDIIDVLRNKASALEGLIRDTIFHKPEGHYFEKGFCSSRNMSNIGG